MTTKTHMQPTQTTYTVEGLDTLRQIIHHLLPNYSYRLDIDVQRLKQHGATVEDSVHHSKFGVYPFFDEKKVTLYCRRGEDQCYHFWGTMLLDWQTQLLQQWEKEGIITSSPINS